MASTAALTRTALLDLDTVTVTGAGHTPVEDVLAAARRSGLVPGTPLTDLDREAAAAAVADLPWVARASVEREWPATVRIEVEERVAVAAVPEPSGVALVAADGRVLEVGPGAGEGPVLLAGVADPPAPGGTVDDTTRSLLTVAGALPDALRASVAAVAPGVDGAVELVLAPASGAPEGARAVLGRPEIDAGLVAVTTMLAQVDLRCLATIDVRVPSKPVLTRDPLCS